MMVDVIHSIETIQANSTMVWDPFWISIHNFMHSASFHKIFMKDSYSDDTKSSGEKPCENSGA